MARSLMQPKRPITVEVGPVPQSGGLPLPGATLCERYHLDEPVARGGSAVVYRATDLMLREVVGIKLLLQDGIFSTPEARAGRLTFRGEAISAMRLSHPMILRVYNYEQHPPWEFLVMEFVAGETLTQYVRRRPERRLGPLETVQLGLDCLEALAYAHRVGIVHNDIKPGNILYTRAGAIKICDFGLARIVARATAGRPVVAGTAGFMSPEVMRGEAGDARSDLFSLAATLYALGNGQLLGPTDLDPERTWDGPPPSAHLPLLLHELLCVAAAPDPGDRFESAEEMRCALERVRDALSDPRPAEPFLEVSSSMVAEADRTPSPTRPGAVLPELADMVEIPGGTITLGDRAVSVAPFRLDRTPVTNGQYLAFLDATASPPPAQWAGLSPPVHKLDHPVVGITLDEARRYAAWRGKRLPTSAEWELAATGGTRRFPWGDAWDPSRCHGPGDVDGTAPVEGHAGGATPEGCLDLVGNVWEWVEPHPGTESPEAGFAQVYGGSFRHPGQVDGRIARTAVNVAKGYDYLGFRCALALALALDRGVA